jgi:hypothetical protein
MIASKEKNIPHFYEQTRLTMLKRKSRQKQANNNKKPNQTNNENLNTKTNMKKNKLEQVYNRKNRKN